MPGPRRNHSKPHIASLNTVEMMDLSPTPSIDTVPSLGIEQQATILDDRSLIDYADTVTNIAVDELPATMESVGEFAISHPAIDSNLIKPEPGTKMLPVLDGARRIQVPKRIDALQESIIQSMCNREELQLALAACEALHIQRFLGDLSNLKYADRGIAWLARRHGITPNELADLWRRHALAQGMMTIISGTPKMAADIMQDSLSRMVNCERCDGIGEVEDIRAMNKAKMNRPEGDSSELIYRVCPQCDGIGKIRAPGSSDSRKMALEAAGLIGKRANIITNPTIYTQTVESVIGELENLQLDSSNINNPASRLRINGNQ